MRAKIYMASLILFLSIPSVFATSPIRSWMTDMYNQISIKPQEKDSMITFPVESVTTDGLVVSSDGFNNVLVERQAWNDFAPDGIRYNPSVGPQNPIKADERSVKNGKYLYNVNCAVCHGEDGKAGTPVGKIRGAAAINSLVPNFTEGYLYMKITYGNSNIALMPPFGYATYEEERWDIVNYLKKEFK